MIEVIEEIEEIGEIEEIEEIEVIEEIDLEPDNVIIVENLDILLVNVLNLIMKEKGTIDLEIGIEIWIEVVGIETEILGEEANIDANIGGDKTMKIEEMDMVGEEAFIEGHIVGLDLGKTNREDKRRLEEILALPLSIEKSICLTKQKVLLGTSQKESH